MRKFTFKRVWLVLFVLAASHIQLSAQQWSWAQKIAPQNGNSRVEVLAIDESSDNYYLTGRFIGTVQYINSFGNTCTTTSSSTTTTDLFVARADNTGRIYWFVKGGQSDGDDQGNDVAALASGRVVVTGYIGKGGSASTATFYNPPIPACSSSATTITTNVYGNGNKKAFIACYNTSTGSILWVSGLEDPTSSSTIESEGRGIAEDPTSSSRFFVTGYFRGDIEFGKYTTSAGVQSCTTQCSAPFYPYQESSEPTDALNTFVMQYYTTGCSNWFSRFYGDPSGDQSDNWNTGEDIISYQDGNESSLFVVGNFKGNIRQPTPLNTMVVAGNLGYFDIMSTSDLQAGYIIKLEYSGGGWSGYNSTPCQYIYPIGGFVSWNNNALAPVYSAQKLETQLPDGIVTVKGVTARGGVSGEPAPVVVGEWVDFSGISSAILYANHQGTTKSIQNVNIGNIADVFIAQYPGDVLSCNWVTSLSSGEPKMVGGVSEFVSSPISLRGADGACGVAYGSSGIIYLTGSFTGDCNANSVNTFSKTMPSSASDPTDIEIYAVAYDMNGDNIFAEGMMGACNAPREDYGTAVAGKASGYTGGFFAGYTNGDLGINRNIPSHETMLSLGTSGTTMSYYGSHAPDECMSPAILPTISTPLLNQFRVTRSPATAPSATVDYDLAAGLYNIAIRDPLNSNPHECVNGLLPGWINIPLTVTISGLGSVVVGAGGLGPALSAGVTYEWFIQGQCGGAGRFGIIDPGNNVMAKNGSTAVSNTKQNIPSFSIAPNPAKNTAIISFSEAMKDGFKTEVFDLNGRRMLSLDFPGNYALQQDLDLSRLSNGIYCIKVTDNSTGNMQIRKLVKN